MLSCRLSDFEISSLSFVGYGFDGFVLILLGILG